MALVLAAAVGWARDPTPGTEQSNSLINLLRELQGQVRDLNSTLQETRAEAARSRAESLELRLELQQTREQLASMERDLRELRTRPATSAVAPVPAPNFGAAAGSSGDQEGKRLANLEQGQELLSAKIDEQDQTKLETVRCADVSC